MIKFKVIAKNQHNTQAQVNLRPLQHHSALAGTLPKNSEPDYFRKTTPVKRTRTLAPQSFDFPSLGIAAMTERFAVKD
ncbi:hypothetical protein J6590_094163 [Homalodisca vitripennis]|nr:hypothetical protein J6590_094163 [Homalodisca vitripennis]